MKTRIKIVALFALLFGFIACNEEDNNVVTQPGDKAVIVSPDQGSVVTLNPTNATNPALTVVWNHAKYSIATDVNYVVEVAKGGTEFAAPKPAGITTQRQITWTVEQLNGFCKLAGLVPFAFGDLDIRIKSSIGATNVLESISEKITVSIKSYSTDLPKLAVAGNHQGWAPATAPLLAGSAYGRTDFEGFVWLNGEFKFIAQSPNGTFAFPPAGGPDYGDNGDADNILLETGEVNITRPAGYYRIRVNTGTIAYGSDFPAMRYKIDPTSWGIAGNATTNGWDGSMPMTYDATTKKWTIITTLATQAAPNNGLKFKANGGWEINLGDSGANGSAEFNGDNIGTTAGVYKITLDLSDPRNYKYTIVPN